MVTKENLAKKRGWYYPAISKQPVMKMSGWKFYIYGHTIEDSHLIYTLLTPIARKYDVTMKVASQEIINRNTAKPDVAWSIAVIYLRPETFAEGKVIDLVEEITTSLQKYPKFGSIRGARSINGKIHYRYDLNKPVDPKEGISYEQYLQSYRGEHGGYNIAGNSDIDKYLKR